MNLPESSLPRAQGSSDIAESKFKQHGCGAGPATAGIVDPGQTATISIDTAAQGASMLAPSSPKRRLADPNATS